MESESWEKLEKEETLQFFKEEKTDDAVYNVYLKKVRYHTSNDEGDDADDGKARLQWRLEEVRIIRQGSLRRLVAALGTNSGDIDSTYVNTFLATYRSFASPKEVLELILNRYRDIVEDPSLKQQHKEGHRKSLKTVLSVWLDTYAEDFQDPPQYPCLQHLFQYATRFLPDSDLAARARARIDCFIKQDDNSHIVSVEDINLEFHVDLLHEVDAVVDPRSYLTRPLDFDSIDCRKFAEQLTYIDSELFKKVLPHHCLGSVWSSRDKKRGQAPSVYATVNQFNAVSYRVIATVLKHPYLPSLERVELIEKWIDIAQELRALKNFSSLKAILSGLQSNPVFRLNRVWAEVDRDRMTQFQDLANIFSEDNNQKVWRDLLFREGTAKYAETDTLHVGGPHRGHARKKSGGWGTMRSRKSVTLDAQSPQTAPSGTVPYLGTFLTDLTMIDTAMKDRSEQGLINFEKKRKEFEILAQIRLLQSAAQLYRLQADVSFFEWFHSIRTYDENESYELSCEIEPVTPVTPNEAKGHRKKSSLGFFSPRRPMGTLESLFRSPSGNSLEGDDTSSVISAPELERGPPHLIRHSVSTGSLHSLDVSEFGTSPLKSSECVIVKAFLDISESHFTNFYKSILLHNSDHTKNVLRNAFLKFDMDLNIEDFVIYQQLPDHDLLLPERGNVFYGINTKVPDIKLVIRRKSDLERVKAKHAKKHKHKSKFTL